MALIVFQDRRKILKRQKWSGYINLMTCSLHSDAFNRGRKRIGNVKGHIVSCIKSDKQTLGIFLYFKIKLSKSRDSEKQNFKWLVDSSEVHAKLPP